MQGYLLLCLIVILPTITLQGQSFTTTGQFDVGNKKIIDIHTGESITKRAFNARIKENSKVALEPVYGVYGEIDHFLLDTKNTDGIISIDTNQRPAPGESFPPFIMKNTAQETVAFGELRGQYILLYFELMFHSPVFDSARFETHQTMFRQVSNAAPFQSIILTMSTKKQLENTIDPKNYPSHLVTNSQNWMFKYYIDQYPTGILIDKNGYLIRYYHPSELNRFQNDLTRIK